MPTLKIILLAKRSPFIIFPVVTLKCLLWALAEVHWSEKHRERPLLPPQVTQCCPGLSGCLASSERVRSFTLPSSPLRAALQTSGRAHYSQSDTERELFRPSLRLATSVTNGTANSKPQSSISLRRREKGGWASWSEKEIGHCRMVEEKYFPLQCL